MWNLLDYGPSEVADQPGGSLAVYETMMTTVASTFPSLKKLHIWVEARLHKSDPEAVDIELYEGRLLEPADAMVQKYGLKLKDFQLAPNLSLFVGLMRRAERKGMHVEKGGIGIASWQRFWRPVNLEGIGLVHDTTGYWVREGKDDTPPW